MEEAKKGISRRSFLKGVAVGAAGIAAAGALAGCGEETGTKTPPKEGEEPKKLSFEVPPEPIPEKDIKETVTADVVVCGAGIAGLSAALSAAEAGAKTILIEKTETFQARGKHNAAIGSRVQKKLGIEVDMYRAARDFVKWGGNKVDQRLFWVWANKSGEVMDWLTDMAEAEGLYVTIWYGYSRDQEYLEHPTAHLFYGGPNQDNNFTNKDLAAVLEKNAKKKGVDIRYKTPAVQLIRQKNGRVTGVIAKTSKGNYIRFVANKGVILCTGSFHADREMLEYYCPLAARVTNIWYAPEEAATGDGHKMALWIGAAFEDQFPHAPMIHGGGKPYLRVNKFGERYENEDVGTDFACNGVLHQPDCVAWAVFDSKWPEEIELFDGGLGRDYEGRAWGEPRLSVEEEKQKFEAQIKEGRIITADTIDELAQKMKVPAETFKATVARYNELAKLKKDLDFGKRPELLTMIERPPFYASKVVPGLLTTVAGLKINTKMQVLDKNGKVIPGLYAAGNASGGMFANEYPVILPGISHGRALTFGRLAGQYAAAEKV